MLAAADTVTLYVGGQEGAMAPAPLSTRFQSLPPLPTIKLGPSGADSRVRWLVHALGPCGSLQQTLLLGWEFLPLPSQPPWVFSIRGLRLYFCAGTLGCSGLFCSPAVPSGLSTHKCGASGSASCPTAYLVPQSTTLVGPPATAPLRVLSAPAARVHPSYRSGWMILLYLLGCQTYMQFDFLSVLVVFCF